ncbi:MAG: histidine phosphatase family protein [Chthoniobacterales bacterium]
MIYLIRHGATEWAMNGRHTGRSDIPLTPEGREEAKRFIPVFKEIKFDLVLSSPMQRARDTAALAGVGDQVKVSPDLQEWDYGDYEGITTPEIRKTVPSWTVFTHPCPNGETIEHISARADHVVERIAAVKGNVVLFSHGHFLRVLACRWTRLDAIYGQHLLLGTSTLSILAVDRDIRVLRTWNGPLTTSESATPWSHPHHDNK